MNIYVGNLNYETTEEAICDIFSQYGTVKSVRILVDRETGRSRGYGFIEMENRDEGQAAIDALDGYELDGRRLKVKEGRGKKERHGGNQRRRRGGGNNPYRNRYEELED